MHFIALPALTAALRRPVAAAILEPLLGLATDQTTTIPPGALVVEIVSPPASTILAMPAALPGAGQLAALRAWDDWIDQFLAAAIRRPRLEASEISDAIGVDREHLAISLLRAWSFAPDVDGAFPRLPSPSMCAALSLVATRSRRLPSEIVHMPLSAFVYDWRVLLRGGASLAEAELIGDRDGN